MRSSMSFVLGAMVMGGVAALAGMVPQAATQPAGQPADSGAQAPAAAQPSENLGSAKSPYNGEEMPILSKRVVGVTIEEIKPGDGKEATRASTITIHYHGTLENGSSFDSTVGKDPLRYPLMRFIQGWQFGIAGMKEGGIRRLTIAPELAYGPQEKRDANGNVTIPANSTLIFWIELQKVE